MTLRVLIVDDESPARERLRRLLEEVPDVEIIAEAQNGIQAIEMIEEQSPDLVFLDIQMPGLDGFGVVEALNQPPPVIFVTAYDEYAIRAFEVNALDYLLKPFSKERLVQAIGRAREDMRESRLFQGKLGSLLMSFAGQGRYLARLAVWHGGNIHLLEVDDIDWIGIEGSQSIVHVGEEVYPVRRTLAELGARLDPERFFRAHRSAIVNLDRVSEIIPWFKGSHKLRLSSGAEVELSRARARDLRRFLEW
jgi:two-component system LytT family response regulator